MKLKFITSAAKLEQCPSGDTPEVVVMGRSNAGKSSFINALAQQKVAKVSQQPGKTRLLNFFQTGDHYRLVDMPGYGYAAVSGSEQRKWESLIEGFLSTRGSIAGGLLIMDIRRKWTDDEAMLADLFQSMGRPLFVVLNKADKLGQGAKVAKRREIKDMAGVSRVFTTSANKGKGILEVEKELFEQWIRPLISEDEISPES